VIERLCEVERRLNALMQALQSNEGRLAAVEQSNWQRAGMPFPWAMAGCRVALATSAITARSTTTYGTGTATLQADDGTDLDDTSTEVDVKNVTDFAIADGSYVILGDVQGSWWVLVAGSCDNLS
jgi:hypothetical protein